MASIHAPFSGLTTHGRTLLRDGMLHFNWSLSGFSLRFTGRVLRARLQAKAEHLEGTELPYLGVEPDDSGTLCKRFKVEEGAGVYPLAEFDEAGTHRISVWKLSESFRGKCALLALETDGAFLPDEPPAKDYSIEFIGDSITCGYGNEAPNRDAPFTCHEENAFAGYANLTCRALNAEPSLISVSGIRVAVDRSLEGPMELPGMEELYAWTDKPLEGENGEACDFAAHPKDAIVVNLGTNDAVAFMLSRDPQWSGAFFRSHYRGFLEQLRAKNGPKPWILCTLGPLDYYLYDEIRSVVTDYVLDTGDTRISCFKYIGVIPWSEGWGAVGHPSAKTHARMAQELTAELRRRLS